jgi:hypothetical protein
MSDQDLLKRLRQTGQRVAVPCPDGIKGCAVFHFIVETEPTCAEAADRIEQLLEDRNNLFLAQESLVEMFRESGRKRKAAETKLAKAVEALHQISLGSQNSGTTKESLGREARAVLTELEKTE